MKAAGGQMWKESPGERAKGRTCPRYPFFPVIPPPPALLFGTSEESLDRELPAILDGELP